MKYRNAGEILPEELLKELQKYVSGETLYIPSASERKGWGESSGARRYYRERNAAIREKFAAGATMAQLGEEYALSVDAIRKILGK